MEADNLTTKIMEKIPKIVLNCEGWVSEAQGHHCEAMSERSVEQIREPMDKNWI